MDLMPAPFCATTALCNLVKRRFCGGCLSDQTRVLSNDHALFKWHCFAVSYRATRSNDRSSSSHHWSLYHRNIYVGRGLGFA